MFGFEEPCLYMDVDTVFTNKFDVILQALQKNDYAFAYYVRSSDWIYEDNQLSDGLRSKSHLFSSGFLAKGKFPWSLAELTDKLIESKEVYHQVRKPGVVDQPLFNFIVDYYNLGPILNVQETTGLSNAVTPKDDITVKGDWTASYKGVPVPFLHAAGHFKLDQRCKFVFDAMLMRGFEFLRIKDDELLRELIHLPKWE